jgi:hypothetical protein
MLFAFQQIRTSLVIGLAGQVLRPLFIREIAIGNAARPRFPRLDANIPQNDRFVKTLC